jgi:RimJ/RimL family protein N-acetyltransferase
VGGLKDAVTRWKWTSTGQCEQDSLTIALAYGDAGGQVRDVGDDVGRDPVRQADRFRDIHSVYDEFEYPCAQILTERDSDGADCDNAVGAIGGYERECAAQSRLVLFARVFRKRLARLDASSRDRVVVGEHIQHLDVVGLGIRNGDLGGRFCQKVLLDDEDGAGGVTHEAPDIPDTERRLQPLGGLDLGNEVEERVGGGLEVGRACHATIVALDQWQDMRMTAKRPAPIVLEGRFVRLEPLLPANLDELGRAIGTPQVFAGGYGGGPQGYLLAAADFPKWALGYYTWDTGNPFLIRAHGGPLDGVALGTSTLGDFDERREHAHIGWTAYDPRVWGSQVNAETKLLMLGHAFDSGFGRVKIQTDVLNERSQAAIAGLGAVREGVVRRDMPRADGTWRDSVVFSILIDEWPEVRMLLQDRLAQWGDQPVQYRQR